MPKNICDTKKQQYFKDDYFDIKRKLRIAKNDPLKLQELYEYLQKTYAQHIADSIKKAIEDNVFDSEWDMKPVESPSPVSTPFNVNGAKNSETVVDELSAYYLNKENSLDARNRLATRFFGDIVSRVLYNKEAKAYLNPTTDSVNEALYNYKLELLQNLWEYTGISHEDDVDDENLTIAISRTVSDFVGKNNDTKVDKYYDDYVILRNFNKLLNDNTPFIKLNSAFTDTDYHAKNMYVWDPSGSYRQSWTDSEDSDISKTASPLIKLLADYFTTEQGVPIGFKMYNIAMSTVAIWIHENSHIDKVNAVNRDLRVNGLNADFGKMIDVYIEYATPNEGLKQILEGIKSNIFNKITSLPIKIRQAFANQFFLTAKYAYVAYRQDYNNGDKQIKGQFLEDTFIDIKVSSLMKRVRNNVWMYQNHPKLFEQFKTNHGIKVSCEDGEIKINFDKRYLTTGNGFSVSVIQNGESIDFRKNTDLARFSNDSNLITLIQDLLNEIIPNDYNDILTAMSVSAPVAANLFDTFIYPICILLSASQEGIDNKKGNNTPDLFKYTETEELMDWNYRSFFSQCGSFEGIKDGINELNVLKNGEGNNLPVYQLSPAVFDVFTLIDELYDAGRTIDGKSQTSLDLESIVSDNPNSSFDKKIFNSVYGNNLFVKLRGLLRKIVVRSDVKIGNRTKSSDKLTIPEVTSLAIFNDFYQNLVSINDPKRPSEFAGNILLQPITFSDKKSHFLPLIDLSKLSMTVSRESVTAREIFRAIVNQQLSKNDRNNYISAVENRIISCRHDKVRKQIFNQYLRFYNVFGHNASYKNVSFKLSNGQIISETDAKKLLTENIVRPNTDNEQQFDENLGFKYVATVLNNLNKFSNPLEILRKMFKNSGTLLNEDFDVLQLKNGKLQANETLYFNYLVFNKKNSDRAKTYFDIQKKLFAIDLVDNDISLDEIDHPEIKSYNSSFTKDGDYKQENWYNKQTGVSKVARFFRNGKEVFPKQSEIESQDFRHDPTISVELNPMIEGFFYANALFGNQINEVLLGGTEGYIPKATKAINFLETDQNKINNILFNEITPVFASRLANEFKRTTYEGAIKRKFASGLMFGVAPKIRTAIVDDSEPIISTLRGEHNKQVAQDGAGWSSPLLHRMQNESLVDSPVGFVKKTIAGWVDPRTGTQNHFKWAENAITMDMRQRSYISERMFRKMHDRFNISDKFNSISNLEVYYNPMRNAQTFEIQEHQITRTDYIYRYDVDSGYYYRLDQIRKNGKNIDSAWTLVDKDGVEITVPGIKSRQIIPTEIKTLYDIDKALGGRYTFEYVNGQMVTSEAVHDILYNIACTNNMKEDFVGYIVNHSAAKAGAVNMNSSTIFENDDEELNTFYISSFGIGVQMDADHELDFASVTEMGQMISLLTQGGYNVDLVNHAYEDIGRVAAEAMHNIIKAVDSNDSAIYRIIGKSLLDTFESGSKEELGLAQAFIRNAQNAILKQTGRDDIILPYSAESIKGSFISAVTALINKTGIRRKYAGFGAVQAPAEGVMQFYTIDGIDYDYLSMRNKIRNELVSKGISFEDARTKLVINGIENPFAKKINQKDINWEDTIIIKNNATGIYGEPIKISNGSLFDKYRNLIDGESVTIYRLELQPKELTQNDLRYNVTTTHVDGSVSENIVSEFDIDPIRAIFYINELIAYKKSNENISWLDNKDRKLKVIFAAISNDDLMIDGQVIADINNVENFNINLLENLKKLCINKAQNYFNDLSKLQKDAIPGTLPVQMCTINDDPNLKNVTQVISPRLNNITAKVILGRRNFKQFLLKKGDKLSTIKEQNWEFFFNRLKSQTSLIDKVRYQFSPDRYDGILHLGNGDNVLVLVGDQSDNLKYFDKKTQDIVVSDRAVSYKGVEIFDNSKLTDLCTVQDLSFYSCIGNDGQLLNVIHVPTYDVFDRIRTSDNITSSQYNYNGFNFLDILKHRYKGNFDEEGNLKSEFEINDVTINKATISNNNYGSNIWDKLNGVEGTERRKRLETKAKLLYRNFMKQLHYIQTRIPAQAMQSTMNIEVIDFADTDTNYIWVPKMLMLLQGSDLDIDKAYCMGYDISDSGNISCLSDLAKSDKYDIDDLLLLPPPTFGRVQVNLPQSASQKIGAVDIDFTETLAKVSTGKPITILSSILDVFKQYPKQTVNLIIDWSDNRVSQLIDTFEETYVNDANIHELSTRSDVEKERALRNQVLAAARRIMNDPASQLNAYTPIAMSEPRAAAELNTALGSKEKEMTLDNPLSIFIMQKQNMSGKEVIAMTATGIKSYFIVTTYFNTLANSLSSLIDEYIQNQNSETGNKIVSVLNEITFDGKLDDSDTPVLRTFANINFYDVKRKLAKLIEETGRSEIYYTEYEKLEANSAFEQYAKNGILDLEKIIQDLDSRANGGYWKIETSDIEELATSMSNLLKEVVTKDQIERILFDGDALSNFINEHETFANSILDLIFGTYSFFTINAPDSLSALLSAATDNAKELILDKLNATAKFADIYTTLLSQGVPFINIAKMMTNNAFRIVAKYSQDNIFDPSTSFFNVNQAIKFVLNDGQLSSITRGLFESFLTDAVSSVENHPQIGFYNIIENIQIDGTQTGIPDIIWKDLLKSGETEESLAAIVKNLQPSAIKNGAVQSHKTGIKAILLNAGNNSLKNKISKSILNQFNNTTNFVKTTKGFVTVSEHLINSLLDNLSTSLISYKAPKKVKNDSDDFDDLYDEQMFIDSYIDSDLENDIQEDRRKNNNFWYDGSIGKLQLVQINRYVEKYFIPKTQLWNSLSEEDKLKAQQDFVLLSDNVLYATKEMKMLGSFGSINQGLKSKDFDEYKFVKSVNKFINNAFIYRGKDIEEEFDLLRFINETERTDEDIQNERDSYHDRQIKNYDKVKSAVNILKAIDYTGNFKEMFKYIATNRNIIENSIAVKMERRLEDQLLRSSQPKSKNENISKCTTIVLNQNDFKTLSQYCRDLIVLNFFAGRHDLKITIPAGEAFYTDDTTTGYPELNKDGIDENNTITLDNVMDLATFKHLMDWYIIPKLKSDPRFPNNAFLKNLVLDKFNEPVFKQPVISYKVSIPLINIDDSPKAKQLYSNVLTGFNELLYCPIGDDYKIGDWTIGNLFYMYNLIVNKDRIGSNAFTRLFEDLVSSGNGNSLSANYYEYISDLDKGKINPFNEDGTINTEVFMFNLDDLKYRLCNSDNAYRFGVTKDFIGRSLSSISIHESEDGALSSKVEKSDDVTKISDFILNLPLSTNTPAFIKPNDSFSENFNAKEDYTASSTTVLNGLIEEIKNLYGKNVSIDTVNKEDIDTLFKGRDDLKLLKEASGFIIDGVIYLNSDKVKLDTPLHEIMHLIAASMKFNDDPRIVHSYYELLDWITNWLDGSIKSGNKDDAKLKKELLDKEKGAYANRYMSDVKEEILVTLLAREFRDRFSSTWGASREISKDRVQATIKMVIAKMLNSKEIMDVDFNKLGNATLISVLKKFSSQILNADSSLENVLRTNQDLADLKSFLVKGKYITLSEGCL